MAKNKTVKLSVKVPADITEVALAIQEIGSAEREIKKINDQLNKTIDELKVLAMQEIAHHTKIQQEKLEGLYLYAEPKQQELTDGGKKKTVSLPTGTMSWRLTPPSVQIKGEEEVLKRLEALGLSKFIRVKKDVDKSAMLKEPALAKSIEGVKISQKEEFVVKPAEVDAEISKSIKFK